MKNIYLPEKVAPYYDLLSRLKRLCVDTAYPLASVDSIPPFFIMGSGRCGSTLLRRMLQINPSIHIPPETYVLGEVSRLFMRNRQMDWHHLVNLVLSTFEYTREFECFGISTRELAHQLWKIPKQDRSLAAILDAFYRYHGRKTEQTFTIWGDKTPSNTFDLDLIIRVFPQAKFIHLLRDGVDVAASFVQRGLIQDIESAASHWQESVLLSYKFMKKHPQQCYEVRYEDLVAEPKKSLQQLCYFLDVSFDPNMMEDLNHTEQMGDLHVYTHYEKVLEPVSTRNIGLGKTNLSDQDLNIIKRKIGPTLKQMGYIL